jgi:hypothetical protein
MTAWIQSAIIAVMFLAAHSGAFADETKPGDKVAAKFSDGSHYLATVTAASGAQFDVLYDDGDKGDVAAGDMVRTDADLGIAAGARVLACWQGARMYPGTVTMRTQDLYTVKWDDGSAPLEVPRGKIAPLPDR